MKPWLLAAGIVVLLGGCTGYEPQGPIEPTIAQGFEPWIGDGDLVIQLYEDYQCPHCREWELEGLRDHVVATWVDTGKVRIMVRPVAFIGPDSVTAAIFSLCVNDQVPPGRWDAVVHDLYEAQGTPRSGWVIEELLLGIAEDHGLDIPRLTECRQSQKPALQLESNRHNMQANGVQGTPGFVIEGKYVHGLDRDAVDAAIQAALA